MQRRQLKNPESYTSKNVYDFWVKEFQAYNKQDYNQRGFIGNDLNLLKQAIETYGIYAILLAILRGVKNGEVAIKYFIENISEYVPSTQYSKYMYLIKENKNIEAHKLLNQLLFLESKWLPGGDDESRKKSIIETLDRLLV